MHAAHRVPLFIQHPGQKLALEKGHIVFSAEHSSVTRSDSGPRTIPFSYVSAIVVGKSAAISSPLIAECMRKNIPVFFSESTDILGSCLPSSVFRPELIAAQVDFFRNPDSALPIASKIVRDKINAQITLIKQYLSNYSSPAISRIVRKMKRELDSIDRVSSIQELMGKEGIAAADYWKAFSLMLPDFISRKKHPATDPLNAILSYGYAVLAGQITAYTAAAGFQLNFGLLHTSSSRRAALVCDLMEPFRAPCVDKIILSGFHRKRYSADEFERSGNTFTVSQKLKSKFLTDFFQTIREDESVPTCRKITDYINSIASMMTPEVS